MGFRIGVRMMVPSASTATRCEASEFSGNETVRSWVSRGRGLRFGSLRCHTEGVSAEEPWVQVVPYDVRWAESYRVESAAIGAGLGDYVSGIEHFGSTAVPGLTAKPIVDILAGAKPEIEPHAAFKGLSALGYEYLGEDGRRPGATLLAQERPFQLQCERRPAPRRAMGEQPCGS